MKHGFARFTGFSLAALVIGAGPALAADPSTTSGQTQNPASTLSPDTNVNTNTNASGSVSGGAGSDSTSGSVSGSTSGGATINGPAGASGSVNDNTNANTNQEQPSASPRMGDEDKSKDDKAKGPEKQQR